MYVNTVAGMSKRALGAPLALIGPVGASARAAASRPRRMLDVSALDVLASTGSGATSPLVSGVPTLAEHGPGRSGGARRPRASRLFLLARMGVPGVRVAAAILLPDSGH